MHGIEHLARDFRKETPVSDEIFNVYRSFYSYDQSTLEPHVESVDDTHPDWRKERVSFRAAYGSERVPAYLYLPRRVVRPLQTVVWVGGGNIVAMPASGDRAWGWQWLDFVIRSGRAVLCPVYKGTFERRYTAAVVPESNEWRDRMIYWSKDFGRSIDYIESRPDLDARNIAYYGLSMGGAIGPILTAIDGRIKTSILLAGGFYFFRRPPESEAIHFAPRVHVPVLMLNGRDDFYFPVEQSQVPMFRLLGSPEKQKRHVVFDSGHAPPVRDVMKEVLAWLDRYLGPTRKPDTADRQN